jgi:hypothetical protein
MDVIQQWVQIDLKISSLSIVTFTFELVEAIEISDATKGKFAFAVAPNSKDLQTKVQIELRPHIKVEGYTLKTSY